jgi:hypothetical protein
MDKKFEFILKDAEILLEDDLVAVKGGASLCGNCCLLLAGGSQNTKGTASNEA